MRISHLIAVTGLFVSAVGPVAASEQRIVEALVAEVSALRSEVAEIRAQLGQQRMDGSAQLARSMGTMDGLTRSVGGEPVIPAGLLPFVPPEAKPILLRQQGNGAFQSDMVGPFAAFTSFRTEADMRTGLQQLRGVDPSLIRAVNLDDLYVIYVGPYQMLSEAEASARLMSRQVQQPFRLRDRSGRVLP